MPYNSTAFEKQLAEFKKRQAAAVASAASTTEDGHLAKSRVIIGRGEVLPKAPEEPAIKIAPELRIPTPEPVVPIIVKNEKPPFFRQSWFIFLLFTVVTSAAIPAVLGRHMDGLMDMAEMVKSSTGVDPFSVKTYGNMLHIGETTTQSPRLHFPAREKGTPAVAEAPAAPPTVVEKITEKISTIKIIKDAKKVISKENIEKKTASSDKATRIQTTSDLHEMVDMASQKAAEVTAQGPEHSMQYIEEESKRLNDMAKQFDETYGPKHE
jgi:hypothetical protein